MAARSLIGLSSISLLAIAFAGGLAAQPASVPASPPVAQQSEPAAPAAPSGPADNQIANEVDARIAQLKSGLRLTVDQEKNWPGLQSALHDFGIAQFKGRKDEGMRRYDRRDRDKQAARTDRPDDIALMRKDADRLTARADSLRALSTAVEPLYRVLDDRQKQKLMGFMRDAFEARSR